MVTLMVHQIMNSTADKTASVTPFIRMQSMIEGMEGTAGGILAKSAFRMFEIRRPEMTTCLFNNRYLHHC